MADKLTLAVDRNVAKKAKKYARQRKLSLSKLVEFFFASLTSQTSPKDKKISPITAGLKGMIKAADIDEKEVLSDALIRKYL